MLVTKASYPTAHASKYLQQLCKHFQRKAPVTFDETRGRCEFEQGVAELFADADGLTVRIAAADAKAIIGARYVIDIHLVNFAFREEFTGLSWTMEPTAA